MLWQSGVATRPLIFVIATCLSDLEGSCTSSQVLVSNFTTRRKRVSSHKSGHIHCPLPSTGFVSRLTPSLVLYQEW